MDGEGCEPEDDRDSPPRVESDPSETPTSEIRHSPARAAGTSRTLRYVGAHYRIERKLGSGGMGDVWLARDELLDRWVAVKVLLPSVADLPGVRERFRDEARAMARIRHPHVVGVHSFGEEQGLPYLVMEHVPGEPLSRLVARRGGPPLAVDHALAILDQIARGVSAIHGAGLVHRDLKPSNVLVGPAGRVAITDLGIAAAIRSAGVADDEAWGTPGYGAPEVLDGTVLTPELRTRTDVFSLGVIAYELLTGKLPFRSHVDVALHAYEGRSPTPPSVIAPKLPVAVDAAILAAIDVLPERRTRSADAFRRALLDAAEAIPRREESVRIVVADDDPDYRGLAARVLAKALRGATIEAFPDGLTALAAARRTRPDLVVTDLDMPGMDGTELIAALHRDPTTRDVPIVVASACGNSNDWGLLCRTGADAFLDKPFEAQQLVTVVRGALGAATGA